MQGRASDDGLVDKPRWTEPAASAFSSWNKCTKKTQPHPFSEFCRVQRILLPRSPGLVPRMEEKLLSCFFRFFVKVTHLRITWLPGNLLQWNVEQKIVFMFYINSCSRPLCVRAKTSPSRSLRADSVGGCTKLPGPPLTRHRVMSSLATSAFDTSCVIVWTLPNRNRSWCCRRSMTNAAVPERPVDIFQSALFEANQQFTPQRVRRNTN